MKKFLPEAGFSGRVMRRLAVLLVIWTAGLSAVRAQQSQQTIAVNFRNATVQQVFTWLDNHTQYDFVYNNSQIESLPRVSMQMSRTTVVDVVKHCLRNSSLSYQIRGNMVVIRPADEIKKGTEEAVQFSGVVYDENGLPLAGVSVVLKQASRGAVTGPDGKFTLKARRSDDMTLSFSFLGMKNQEIAVFNNGKQVFKELDKINVHMDPAVSEIGNVVVTGILNIAQKSFSGSSTTITGEQLKTVAPQGNALSAIQIFEPSFRIAENLDMGSNPNALPQMYVRGRSGIGTPALDESLTSEHALKNDPNQPIFMLDGYEVSMEKIYDLDIERIETYTILKDAAATAIYGSRGANGVVMVTTRSGQAGKPTLSVNAEYGLSIPRYRIEMMNSEQYAEYDNFARMMWGVSSFNTLRPDTLTTNDYQKRLLRDIAQRHNYTVALQGGSKDMRYYISGGWLSEEGILRHSSNERLSFSTKFNMNLSPRLHLDVKASLSRQQTEKISSGDSGATLRMLMQKPTSTINGTDLGDGTYIDEETGEIKSINTEAAKALNSNQWNKRTTAELNAVFRWDIDKRKYWTFNSTAGYKYNNSNDYAYVLRSIYSTEAHIDKNNKATRKTSQGITWSNENFINFSRTFRKKHYLMWTLGQSWQRQESEGFDIDVTRFDTDYFMWNNLGAGAYIGVPGSSYKAVNHLSFFTRAIYTYNERFTATFCVPTDRRASARTAATAISPQPRSPGK